MGNSKTSAVVRGILTYAILFIFAVEMMKVAKVDAKTCTEGLPWVKNIVCYGEKVTSPCWNECQRRHGTAANARCGSSPAFPEYEACYCDYPC